MDAQQQQACPSHGLPTPPLTGESRKRRRSTGSDSDLSSSSCTRSRSRSRAEGNDEMILVHEEEGRERNGPIQGEQRVASPAPTKEHLPLDDASTQVCHPLLHMETMADFLLQGPLDSPNNPFAPARGAAHNRGRRSTNSRSHRFPNAASPPVQAPIIEKGKMTYVFRGHRIIYPDPEGGESDSEELDSAQAPPGEAAATAPPPASAPAPAAPAHAPAQNARRRKPLDPRANMRFRPIRLFEAEIEALRMQRAQGEVAYSAAQQARAARSETCLWSRSSVGARPEAEAEAQMERPTQLQGGQQLDPALLPPWSFLPYGQSRASASSWGSSAFVNRARRSTILSSSTAPPPERSSSTSISSSISAGCTGSFSNSSVARPPCPGFNCKRRRLNLDYVAEAGRASSVPFAFAAERASSPGTACQSFEENSGEKDPSAETSDVFGPCIAIDSVRPARFGPQYCKQNGAQDVSQELYPPARAGQRLKQQDAQLQVHQAPPHYHHQGLLQAMDNAQWESGSSDDDA